jgi:hypothetical protein
VVSRQKLVGWYAVFGRSAVVWGQDAGGGVECLSLHHLFE